jgi:peptidoglycan hydrolase-like protein with peptidoglycan-binding domain
LQTAAGVLTYAPDYVSKIQKLLNQVVSPSPNLDVDGYIGVKTKDAVAKYQKAKGLVVDGFPGDNTLVALREDAVKTVPLLLGGEGEKKNTVEVPKVAPAGVNPILNAKP